MKALWPSWLIPINIFHIRGVLCCNNIKNNFANNNFTKYFLCYSTTDIYQANMIVIWGYISPQLSHLIARYYAYLPPKRFIIHITPCHIIPAEHQSLSATMNIKCAMLDTYDIKLIIKEARQCLQA